jgi:hypothetical protein
MYTHKRDLQCSLEELYRGTTRRMKISRKRLDASGQQRPDSEMLEIPVRPGWKAGTKITFQEKGDEHPGRIAADIIFVVQEKPHPVFRRDGNDLIYTHRAPLVEALCGTAVHLQTLDGRPLSVPINSPISLQQDIVVPGEGMPITKQPGQKGNLRIRCAPAALCACELVMECCNNLVIGVVVVAPLPLLLEIIWHSCRYGSILSSHADLLPASSSARRFEVKMPEQLSEQQKAMLRSILPTF